MSINVNFTTPPTAPSSTDKTNFRTRYDAFLAYIQMLGNLLITFISQLNSTETNINAKEASAVAAQVAAAASANFKGIWTNQTTEVGQSWLYGGIIYRVLISGNQSPLTAPSNWQAISPVFGRISETFTTVSGTWYRIAQSNLNINRCDGIFSITFAGPGHCKARFSASISYVNPCISQIGYSRFSVAAITKARIVYHTTYAGNYAYLEVYVQNGTSNQVFSVEATDTESWSLLPPSTLGEIPSGYSSLEYTFKSTITPGTFPVVTVDSDGSVTDGSTVLPNGTTATTQAAGDNSADVATTAYVDRKMTLMASVTASGTAVDFTTIPSWVKRITVMFSGVSLSGSSHYLIQIGKGSIVTSGYTARLAANGLTTGTNGFLLFGGNSAGFLDGKAEVNLLSANKYVFSAEIASSSTAYGISSAGNVTLGGALDRVRITTVNGTDTFNAGTISVRYEG